MTFQVDAGLGGELASEIAVGKCRIGWEIRTRVNFGRLRGVLLGRLVGSGRVDHGQWGLEMVRDELTAVAKRQDAQIAGMAG